MTSQIRIDDELVDKLKNLSIVISWVELKSFSDKVSHLLWFYNNHNINDDVSKDIKS